MLLLERLLVARAQFVDSVQIDFVERGEQRLRRLRLHHALGNARAQPGHGHPLLGAAAACGLGAGAVGATGAGAAGGAAGAGASLAAR